MIRLEERGWIVHGAHHHPSSSKGEGAGAGTGAGGKDAKGNVVVVKTGKKVMDQEHYLDATQRYVLRPSHLSFYLYPPHLFTFPYLPFPRKFTVFTSFFFFFSFPFPFSLFFFNILIFACPSRRARVIF